MMGLRIGIDTGGTFTDLVLMDGHGRAQIFKTPSTPDAPPDAIRNGLKLIAEDLNMPVGQLLQECELIIHGTTVALNALLQLKGARTALLCTRGHEDSLEIRNGHKEDGHRYDFGYPAAPMLVPRRLRIPITERVLSDGSIRTALDEGDVHEAIDLLRREEIEAVGISFMWSFIHPQHERRAGALIAAELPGVDLTLSCELLPQIREYTRTSTVAVNAFVAPILSRHIEAIEAMLDELGYAGRIRYVQSNGGITSGQVLAKRAASALNSGPAAGPAAGLHYGTRLDRRDVLTLDMGGTSTDISLVRDGKLDLVKDIDIGRYRVGLPQVNVISIGAGGGSIASLDTHGILRVGPESAEAIPGPACYMRGGDQPTVTDALVVLGYLSQTALLGGRMPIDAAAAAAAVTERIARPLGIAPEDAALGIFNVVNANMIGGIRSVSIERGHDPRDFALVAGGGATSAHAGRLAADLRMPQVIIPKVASGLCAFGEAVADVKHTYLGSYPSVLPEVDPGLLNALFAELEERGRGELAAEGFAADSIYVERALDMKYVDQVHECRFEIPVDEITPANIRNIETAFHRRHEALYTYSEPDNVAELINVEVNVYGRTPRLEGSATERLAERTPSAEEHRLCYFEEQRQFTETSVFNGARLTAGDRIDGPAIVEEDTTTIVVFPGCSLSLVRDDAYVMEVS